ncbi:MAG TPA: hypothetical protein VFW33_14705 [Gemmataceae bacterium]|nr:hypothetical protein [Gemmataceae bacterium]
MPEELLPDFVTSPVVAASLENIGDLVRVVVRDAGLAMKGVKGSAAAFENSWRRIVLDVARGRTAEMQAGRPRVLAAFEKRLRELKETHALAVWLSKLGRPESPDPDVLLPEIAGLERLKARVFDSWQTADDLEDLAARDYPLTTADLDRIGAQRLPPASYYTEESKPF